MSLRGGPEPFVTHFQQVRVRPIFDAARSMNSMAVKPLQAVNQHWPILLLEDVTTDLDDSIRAHANEQPVECGVVDGGVTHGSTGAWSPSLDPAGLKPSICRIAAGPGALRPRVMNPRWELSLEVCAVGRAGHSPPSIQARKERI